MANCKWCNVKLQDGPVPAEQCTRCYEFLEQFDALLAHPKLRAEMGRRVETITTCSNCAKKLKHVTMTETLARMGITGKRAKALIVRIDAKQKALIKQTVKDFAQSVLDAED